jgi:hypothetical protein
VADMYFLGNIKDVIFCSIQNLKGHNEKQPYISSLHVFSFFVFLTHNNVVAWVFISIFSVRLYLTVRSA